RGGGNPRGRRGRHDHTDRHLGRGAAQPDESMQNRGGRSGCCWKRLVIVGGPEARIAMAEGVLSVSFSTAVRTSRKGCTLARFQRICCLLFRRLATIALTALSTNAGEIGSPLR